MKLDNLLNQELVFWDVDVQNSLQIYQMIAKRVQAMFALDERQVVDAFLEREKLGYVVFPDGSSLPHGRLDELDDLIIAMVKTKKPLEFCGKKADLFYCVLTSNSGSNRYLMVLASFAKIAQYHHQRVRLTQSPRELIELVKELQLDVDKSLLVSDVINSDAVLSVCLDDSLSKAVDLMKSKGIKFLPVVGKDGRYKGKLNALDIVKAAYPRSSFLMSAIGFMSTSRSFERFHQQEATMRVRDVYSQDNQRVAGLDEQMIQIGFRMVKNNWHHLTVLDSEMRPVAVLSDRSFVSKVLRA